MYWIWFIFASNWNWLKLFLPVRCDLDLNTRCATYLTLSVCVTFCTCVILLPTWWFCKTIQYGCEIADLYFQQPANITIIICTQHGLLARSKFEITSLSLEDWSFFLLFSTNTQMWKIRWNKQRTDIHILPDFSRFSTTESNSESEHTKYSNIRVLYRPVNGAVSESHHF